MINAGAILICSLLKTLVHPEMTLAEKFDFIMNYFKVRSVNLSVLLTPSIGTDLIPQISVSQYF
jgi:glutaminase